MKYSSRWSNPYNRGMGRSNDIPRNEIKNRFASSVSNMHILHKKAYFDTLKYIEMLEELDKK